MNKVKKVATGIGVFISGIVSKVYAATFREPENISMYAVDPGPKETIGNAVETIENAVLKIGSIAIPVVLFLIGLFVVFSKKITKKVKAIVVSALVIVAILIVILMNYILTNFYL